MSGGFAARWAEVSADRGQLCVGLAATAAACTAWGLRPDLAAVTGFADTVMSRTANLVGAFLIHTGFFERFGGAGIELLARLTESAHAGGALVIVDAKRGDAGDVATATADLYLGESSAVGADAMVVHPYLGFRALDPLFAAAAGRAAHVFVLAQTSNDGGEEIQCARLPDGRTVAEYVVDEVVAANARYSSAGLVVGAPEPRRRALFERAGDVLVSLPGLGRPGHTVAEFRRTLGGRPGRAILPVTSGLLAAGPDPVRLVEKVLEWRESLRPGALGAGDG